MPLRQALWLAGANLRAALARPGLALVVAFSVALTVLVFSSSLSVSAGLWRMLTHGSLADRALIIEDTAVRESFSFLYDRHRVRLLGELPRGAVAIASPERLEILYGVSRDTGAFRSVALRGVTDAAFALRPEVEIVAGRMFETGRMEMIVGRRAAAELGGLDIGDTAAAGRGGARYAVVGHFTAGGGPHESEAWAELPMVQSTYAPPGTVSSLWLRAVSPERIDAIRAAVDSIALADGMPGADISLRSGVKLLSEKEFFEGGAKQYVSVISMLALVLGSLMALGAGAATLCVSYWTVRARIPHLASLRALGFGSGALALALTLEMLALTLLGGIGGASAAYLLFDGASTFVRTPSGNAELMAFDLDVTAAVAGYGLAAAAAIGLVGALLPAVQIQQLQIARALQRR